ncbi:putative toxin-antitoxin system toxin component, PIN family [Rhodohalobacter sulfatireducens]|uniref:Toxin-antitoxin system toxin component, PIN family n=1 Tax=Rhodohalobacter sulfatireducens TaxID=2911366 RepID=A0ABS9KGS2_9BACT|nr:putative toxin-antitoxin system toxin component, PIN family [Rhodohalobacter sulfatireducens]MCG2590038.1 putative toxin-antitoxin system toxin component, PIN family [Rhodohalobacter sulfatireducens]
MKIFADTNVLVSAFIARGLCTDLLEVILADHQLITGEIVLNEFERVLIEKLNVPPDKVSNTILFLRKYQIEPIPDKPSDVKVRDEDDRWVLESALRAEADILVTGDKDLLVLSEEMSQIKIISPRGFWDLLKE